MNLINFLHINMKLKIMNKCSVSDYNVQFIFNLNEKVFENLS